MPEEEPLKIEIMSVGGLRLPLVEANEREKEIVRKALEGYELLF